MQGTFGPYYIGILSALVATILFGITNVIYRKIDNEISALNIAISRIWISLPVAFVFSLATTGSVNISLPLESIFPLAISMILGIIIGDTIYFLSQERIGVARAFPITMSYPLVVYLMAAIFLAEPVIIQRIVGAVAVIIGVVIIAKAEQSEDTDVTQRWDVRDKRIGLALALVTILAWASSDVIFQFGLTSAGVAEANYFRILVASIIFVPVFLISIHRGNRLPTRQISAISLITGVFGLGLSLIAYSYAVKYIGATITSILVASAPMITAPLSVIFLNEDVNRHVTIGTVLTTIGIILVVIV